MPDEKRLNYFNGLFLKAEDFIDEQNYHIARLERHNRLLHNPGIADGLDVRVEGSNASQVTVTQGTAIDGNGKQIVLASDRPVPINGNDLRSQKILIVISYDDQEDETTKVGDRPATRRKEVPKVEAVLESSNPSEVIFIRLARISVTAQGTMDGVPDITIRRRAGQPTIADGAIAEIKLAPAVQAKLVNDNSLTEPKLAPAVRTKLNEALSTTAGGTLSKRLRVNANVAGVQATGGNFSNFGALFVHNAASNGYGIVSKMAETADVAIGTATTPAAALVGVSGQTNVHGIYATAKAGTAAIVVDGDVKINGVLSKQSGQFRIDHPLDPTNKYLNHSFVESPDMKNIYDGVVVLDSNGEAIVNLPSWFEVLNKDLRYQLTCIGGYAPVYIAQEVHQQQFKIAGGVPGLKVSWQITGVRQDAWANDHRIPVEELKPIWERGTYLYERDHANQANSVAPTPLVPIH